MITLISSFLKNLTIGKIQTVKNVTIVQLRGSDPQFPQLAPFVVAHEKGWVRIKEITASGSVPELMAENLSDELVLLLKGEVLLGAKQNRTVNTTILLAPRTNTVIPVSCVEQGRWFTMSPEFTPSDVFMSGEMRMNMTLSVNENVSATGKYMSNQGQVWGNVRERISAARVASPTSNYGDYAKAQNDRIKDYMSAFKLQPGATGILGFTNGMLVGCDVIPREEVFSHYFDRLVRSYVLDALHLTPNDKSDPDYKSAAEEFLREIEKAAHSSYPSPGVGESIQIDGSKISGSILTYENAVIHLAMFAINKSHAIL
jgi:hypothetical protein